MKLLASEAKERLAKGEKAKAVAIMKRRKLHEQELQKIGNVKMTLETQAIQLESAAGTAEVFQAMSAGTSTMQKIRMEIGGTDKVDDLMMDMQEEQNMADEVSQAIGQGIDPLMGAMDDDELMKELQAMDVADLEQEFNNAEMPHSNVGKTSNRIGTKKGSNDTEALKKLEAELAGL